MTSLWTTLERRFPAGPRERLRQRLPNRARLLRPARLGGLRRTTPLSRDWGFERGTPIDRFYIERFLDQHRADVRGRVLEIYDSAYTRRYDSGVTRADVLDVDAANPRATIIADLAAADAVPSDQYDCFILTQTLLLIPDPAAAVRHAQRVLRPGGVLLATVPSITRVAPEYPEHDYWRFTVASCRLLFGAAFGPDQVTITDAGNVLSAIAFLTGMASEELRPEELLAHDPLYPVSIAIRAVKAGATAAG